MAQWDVYANPNPRTRQDVPYLLDVQSRLLDGLRTRLVMPLVPNAVPAEGLPPRMVPTFVIRGQKLRLVPHEAGVMVREQLRRPVASLREEAAQVVDALDVLISGV